MLSTSDYVRPRSICDFFTWLTNLQQSLPAEELRGTKSPAKELRTEAHPIATYLRAFEPECREATIALSGINHPVEASNFEYDGVLQKDQQVSFIEVTTTTNPSEAASLRSLTLHGYSTGMT